jgi:hypothetical protein
MNTGLGSAVRTFTMSKSSRMTVRAKFCPTTK